MARLLVLGFLVLGACVADPLAPRADLAGADGNVDALLSDLTSADAAALADLADLAAELPGVDLQPADLIALPVPADHGISAPAFAETTVGLSGASVLDVGVAVGTLYALTPYQLYRSTNSGLSWTALPPVSAEQPRLKLLATARASESWLYIVTEDNRLYGSSTEGQTWELIEKTGGPTSIDLIYLTKNAATLYTAYDSVIHRRSGTSWSLLSTTVNPERFGESDDLPAVLFAGGVAGVYQLDENAVGGPKLVRDVAAPAANRFFVTGKLGGSALPPLHLAAYRKDANISYYNGSTWDTNVPNLASQVSAEDLVLTDTHYFAFCQDGVRRWTLGSAELEWTMSLPLAGTRMNRAIGGAVLIAATDVGPILSNDELSWTLRVTGMRAITPLRFAATRGLPDRLFAATQQGLFRTVDRGGSWQRLDDLAPLAGLSEMVVSESDPDRLYAAVSGRLHVSQTGGTTWSAVTGFPSSRVVDYVAASPTMAARILVCVDGQLNYSTNGGSDFFVPSLTGVVNQGCGPVLFDPTNGQHAWAILDGQLATSNDGGQSFAPANGAVVAATTTRLHQFASEPERLYLVGSDEIRVFEAGQTNVLEVPIGTYATDVAVDPANPAILYVSTRSGLLMSTDHGLVWSPANHGLVDGPPVTTIFVHPGDRRWRAAGVEATGLFLSEGTLLP